jgi:hypothetical protein
MVAKGVLNLDNKLVGEMMGGLEEDLIVKIRDRTFFDHEINNY